MTGLPGRLGAFGLAAALLAPPAFGQAAAPPAADEPGPAPASGRASRFSVFFGGGVALATSAFEGQRRFTEFAEEGRLDSDYARGAGPELELGLEYRLARRFGVGLRFAALTRDASSDYEAELPHPLFLARPRRVSGALDSLSYKEQVVHLELAYRQATGRWRFGVFAGPTYGSLTMELLARVRYEQSYPFDEVRVTTVERGRHTGSGFGFNVGAEADYRLGSPVAVALLVRYHRLSPDLPESAGTVEMDAGGFQVGGGIRLFIP